MDPDSSIILLVILIFLSMVFSSSETALTTISKIRLRNMLDEGIKGADKIEKIMEDPKKLLTTILIGNNIVNIGASAVATSIAIEKAGTGAGNNASAVGIVTGVLTFVILVFGEITPKNLATRNAEKVSLVVAPFLNICMWVFAPVALILNFISSGIIKLLGGDIDAYSPIITEAELKTLVNVSQEEGVLEIDEQKMIHNVFDFSDYTAEEVMTPRTDIVAISYDTSYEEIIEIFDREKYSRIPVFKESTDDIVGLLYLKDFIFSKEAFNIDDYLREVFFTYESKPIKELFAEMRSSRNNMAIVLDEYGGIEGLVTLEDLIEEIVGEILDENDEEAAVIENINENEFIVDGSTKLEDIEDDIGVTLVSDDFETIGGYVTGIAGKIPEQNEMVEDEFYKFEVIEVEKNRVEKVRVTKKEIEEVEE